MLKKCLAEFLGTAILVLFGCGVAVFTGNVVATSLAFGLVLIALCYSFANISEGHFNPAVSLAMAIDKRISWKEFGFYCLSQVLGALLGSLLLGLFLNSFRSLGGNQMTGNILAATQNKNYHAYAIGLLAELVLTFVFLFVILVITNKKEHKAISGTIIGLTLALVHLLGIGITGTSVNPARSFAPALLQAIAGDTQALKQIWIFIIGPMLGSALAAFTYESLFDVEDAGKEKEEK
ncbi:MAG: aquaporin [Acholeplasmatales bacterium]|nr:aquaporin [Acholeplasmatales bacterium]